MGSSAPPDLPSRILRHERLLVAAGILLLVALSWWFLISGAGMPQHMDMMMGLQPPFGALVLMWWLMMVAMMLPSAAPTVLLYGRVRMSRGTEQTIAPTWMFLGGYLAAWLLFSLLAATAQSLLTGASMALEQPAAASAVLIAAGAYQLSPLKGRCLRECRSPAQFLSRHWRPGSVGAAHLGLLHGAYCVGCCWLLMALLFVGGIMNFAWIAVLTLIVGVEKLAPWGERLGCAAGLALILWGAIRLLL